MNIKKLISCPVCEAGGLKMNLAMALPDGRIVIRRFSDNDTTVIWGDNVYVACGHCGETVFHRQIEKGGTYGGTFLRFGFARINRVDVGGTPGTVWAGSN